ncbi:MAG: DUF3667 domain-containing protein [Pseudomonadota bacterium]
MEDSEAPKHRTSCKNCGAPLEARFCPQCGQQDIDLQRPFFTLFRELVFEAFDVDGRAARTIVTLFVHPGALTARFLAGHRKEFTSPVRLYLVISVVFFLVVAWVVRRGILFEVSEESVGEVRMLTENLPTLMFIFLPGFALLLKAAYWRRLYFDHLVHALHLHAAAYAVLAVLMPTEQASNEHWIWLALHIVLATYLLVYLVVSFRRVYESGWLVTAIKAFVVFIAYLSLLSIGLQFASDQALFGTG